MFHRWIVARDGTPQASLPTANEAWMYLSDVQPHSWHYATTYGGWTVYREEVTP